jgi:prepilin-type N-terminal cleavage/methylation domain-containing protein
MTMPDILLTFRRPSRGFTLIELLVALTLSAFLLAAVYKIFNTSQNSQSLGLDLAGAQQNARIALATLEKDLRLAGRGIPPYVQSPVIVASQYRITYVMDSNDNGAVDLGETITFFLDPNTSALGVATTPNPKDMVLRKVVSDAFNPHADPIPGSGEIVASGLTQQVDNDGTTDVPIFGYFDADGTSLLSLEDFDPFSPDYGYTVSDSTALGRPPGGPNEVSLTTIAVTIIAETEARDEFLRDYQRVLLSTALAPRNLPLNLRQR